MVITSGHSDVEVNEVNPAQAARVLAGAFADDPLMRFAFPDSTRRQNAMPWLFRHSVEYGCRYGEVLSTANAEAVAVWFGPVGTRLTIGRQIRSGMLAAPFRLGVSALLRLAAYDRLCEQLHEQCVNEPHMYLFALGVHPHAQGRGLAESVVRPAIDRADRQGLPCYLETTNDRNLNYFARFGFQPALHERMAYRGGYRLNIWSMLRKPLARQARAAGRFAGMGL